MVKSPELELLSEPKFKTNTDVSPEVSSLKINAPRAVIVLDDHVVSAKSVNAVVPLVVGSTRVSVLPLAV